MNTLVSLWNVITRLTQSLSRTVELIDTINAKVEKSIGMEQPEVELLALTSEPTKRKR